MYQSTISMIMKSQAYRNTETIKPVVRLKVRFIVLLMLAKGFELENVASVIGKSIKTIKNWHYQYVEKGIDSLNFFQYKPKQTYLETEQIEEVIA